MAGKGDRPRPVDRGKYEKNWEYIYGKRKCKYGYAVGGDCEGCSALENKPKKEA